jgi:hypothetical protein
MTEPEVAGDKDLADEITKNGKKSKEESSKSKRSAKKKPVEDQSDEEEEEEEAEVIPEAKTKRGAQKVEKNVETGKKKEKGRQIYEFFSLRRKNELISFIDLQYRYSTNLLSWKEAGIAAQSFSSKRR